MWKLDEHFYNAVVDRLNDMDYMADAEVSPDYSGRGMYGTTVTAIVTEHITSQLPYAIIQTAIEEFFDDWCKENEIEVPDAMDISGFIEEFQQCNTILTHQDNMGLGVVYY